MARNWLVHNEPEFNKDKFWNQLLELDLLVLLFIIS